MRITILLASNLYLYKTRITELLKQLVSEGRELQESWILDTFASSGSVVVGAFEGELLVGIAVGTMMPHFTGLELYINDVVVHEDFRGRGIGTELVGEIEWIAKRRGYLTTRLTSSRPDAQKLYERLGYESKTRAFKKRVY